MKKQVLFFLAPFLLISINTCYSQIIFQKVYGNPSYDLGLSCQQTSDGGFIMGGVAYSAGGDQDMYLVKTDSVGMMEWSKSYGGSVNDGGRSVKALTDGGYLAVGATNSFGAVGYDVYVVKTNNSGDTLWTRMYGTGADDVGYCGAETGDGGYIVTGATGNQVYLIKLNAGGDTLWTKTYAMGGVSLGVVVQQTTDNGYMISGYTNGYGSGNNDFLLMKTTSTGDLTWTKTYGGSGRDEAYSAQQTSDGGYVMVGLSLSFGGELAYLVKTDQNGAETWSRTYGGTGGPLGGENGYSVQETSDGGFIIAGVTFSFGTSGDMYLVKAGSWGALEWSYNYGGGNYDYGYCAHQTSDGGYVLLGYTQSFGYGGYDFYLTKTDGTGTSGCLESVAATIEASPTTVVTDVPGITSSSAGTRGNPASLVTNVGNELSECFSVGIKEQTKNHPETLKIFPNPSTGLFTISLKDGNTETLKIEVRNILGDVVLQKSNDNLLDLTNQSPGIYFVRVSDNTSTYNKRIVLE